MSTLANLKKGDTVILHMFTGIAVGVKEVLAADKATVTLETRAGMAKFSRKTGKQIEPAAKAERFANFITEDDGSYVPKSEVKKPEPKKGSKKAAPAPAPATKKKSKPAPEPEEEDDDDYEEPEEEVPAKKKKKK